MNIPAGETRQLKLDLDFDKKSNVEYLLQIYFKTKRADTLIPQHFILASEQFMLTKHPSLMTVENSKNHSPGLRMTEEDDQIKITADHFSMIFDKDEGSFSSYIFDGLEYIEKGLQPNFWRPPTDNDYGAQFPEKLKSWKNPCGGTPLVICRKSPEGMIEIAVSRSCLSDNAWVKDTFVIYPNGLLKVKQSFEPSFGDYPVLPKFGMQMQLPRSFDRMEWYGRGPHESYEDRKTSAFMGRYKGLVSEQFHPYIRPQETGNKTDVRWMYLSREDGKGLLIFGVEPLSMSAWHYLSEDLDDGETKDQKARSRPQRTATYYFKH